MTLPNEQNFLAKPDGQEAYWQSTFDGELPVMQLSTDYPRPVVSSFLRARASAALDPPVYRQIGDICREKNVTLFVLLLAAFKTLLLRHTAQEDIIVGSVSSASTRSAQGTNRQRFTNVLALRTNLGGNPEFVAVLERVSKTVEEAGNTRDYPFEKLVERIQSRHASLSPIFQTMFILRDTPSALAPTPISEGNLADVEKHSNNCDLVVLVCPKRETLTVTCEYDAELFESRTILRLLDHYQVLLECIGSNPGHRVSELTLLTEAERHQLLVEWNDTKRDYPKDKCIHELFEAQVDRTPNSVALVFENRRLTYRELNEQANQLAHYLEKLGVGPGLLVGICAQRSTEMVVGLLGILKAGGAYLPLDPAYPRERLAFMLADAEVSVLLTQERLVKELPEHRAQVVRLDTDWQAIASEDKGNPLCMAAPENLAYAIYTSGSTGKPKGILIPHRGLVNYLAWCTRAYAVEEGEGSPVHSSISFDLTITGLFAPLLVGRKVYLLSDDSGPEALSAALRNGKNFSLVKITPAHLLLLTQQLSPEEASGRTRAFIIGGENLLAESVAFWQEFAPNTTLVNEYGPTESVVGCCVYEIPKDAHSSGSVPIGRPIANTQLYVLDSYLQLVPVGVPGELYISGSGLAWGYLRRPELTAEKFVPHPFSSEIGARLYKTGDLARYLPDGNIEFLGRIDHQVKIRGFRIELGEIESVLSQQPGVTEAIVMAREDVPGDKRLVAYVVFSDGSLPSTQELQKSLERELPDYMIPSAFVFLESLPWTPNGKIDRKALPIPTGKRLETAAYEMPHDDIEQAIAAIWRDVLRVEQVGIYDNFFDLGGHSLLMAEVHSQLQAALGRTIAFGELFHYPTINTLAKYLGHATEQSSLSKSADLAGKQRRALQTQQLRMQTIAQRRAAGHPRLRGRGDD